MKLGPDESSPGSRAVGKSYEDRDRANKDMMGDPEFKSLSQNLPVDGRRMFTGGFTVMRGM